MKQLTAREIALGRKSPLGTPITWNVGDRRAALLRMENERRRKAGLPLVRQVMKG